MTQEDKSLLLKDLCARLPYKLFVNGNFAQKDNPSAIYTIGGYYPVTDTEVYLNEAECWVKVESIKPYLRPMSSMTEEEFHNSPIYGNDVTHSYKIDKDGFHFIRITTYDNEVFDWLNEHHFDFRNLIEKGLAIDCTGLNIY